MIFQTKMSERDDNGNLLLQRCYYQEKHIPATLTNSTTLNRKCCLVTTNPDGSRNKEGSYMGLDGSDAFHQPKLGLKFL